MLLHMFFYMSSKEQYVLSNINPHSLSILPMHHVRRLHWTSMVIDHARSFRCCVVFYPLWCSTILLLAIANMIFSHPRYSMFAMSGPWLLAINLIGKPCISGSVGILKIYLGSFGSGIIYSPSVDWTNLGPLTDGPKQCAAAIRFYAAAHLLLPLNLGGFGDHLFLFSDLILVSWKLSFLRFSSKTLM